MRTAEGKKRRRSGKGPGVASSGKPIQTLAGSPLPSSKELRPGRIESLTGLRFFAAFWVVLLHFAAPQHAAGWPPLLRSWVEHGQLGVAMFFVLSGYVLGYNYLPSVRDGSFDARQFAIARFARVYPVFILSVLIFTPFAIRYTVSDPTISQPWLMLGVELVLQILVLQTWFPKLLYLTRWNTPTWSLGVEMFFYANFYWVARWISRMGLRSCCTLFLGTLAFLAASRAAVFVWDLDGIGRGVPTETQHFWAGLLFFNPIFRLPEFLLGVLAVHLVQQHRDRLEAVPARIWSGALTAVLVGLGWLLAFPHGAGDRIWAAPLAVGLLAGLIFILGMEKVRLASWLLASPLLVLLGEASYAMYVLQRPVAEYFNFLAVRLGAGTVESNPMGMAVYLALLAGASLAAHRWFESPSRRWIRLRFSRPRAKIAAPA